MDGGGGGGAARRWGGGGEAGRAYRPPAAFSAPARTCTHPPLTPPSPRAIAGDEASYRYLVESIRRFPSRPEFARMMADAGLAGVRWTSFAAGAVALHTGFKL